jgi:hypothetical protein
VNKDASLVIRVDNSPATPVTSNVKTSGKSIISIPKAQFHITSILKLKVWIYGAPLNVKE